VDELISHPTRYKDMIDNSKENLLKFREYVRSIKDGSFVSGEVFECNFVLMAFANCTRLKIVVLRPRLCSFVFTPLCEEDEQLKVSYLKHIPPRDYIVVPPLDEPSDEQISNRDQFLESMEYAESLHDKALKSWRLKGYKNYLETLTSLLPKYLTGTEDVLDNVDGSPINRPVMSHLTLLEDIGFGGNEDEEGGEEECAREEEGSIVING
jgi:hypothetical protein